MAVVARLEVLEGKQKGQVFELGDGESIVGRDEDCDITLPDMSVSGRHAAIAMDGDALVVRDLGSSNGIRYLQEKVTEARIQDREYFSIGDVYLRLYGGGELADTVAEFNRHIIQVRDEISRVIIGQSEVVDQLLACLFAGGHCLLVGVPGLAKTVLVKTLSQTLEMTFKRVQFTPDLMPSDITGTNMINMDESGKTLQFVPGPIFTQLLLADEINRTPPKTQAALLEAMQERQVTIGNESMTLPAPFLVVATQNPIEQEGTYPLPEAQLDRFMCNIRVAYPSLAEEEEILRRTTTNVKAPVRKVMTAQQVLRYQRAIQQVDVSPFVVSYVAKLVRSTRPNGDEALGPAVSHLEWGAGPRAGQYLIWGGKAYAAMDGRLAVSCDDIRRCAVPVLRHRLAPNFEAQANGISTDQVVENLLAEIREPEVAKFA